MDRRKALVVALAIVLAACTTPARWATVVVPQPEPAELEQQAPGHQSGISCPTADFCLSVGRNPDAAAWDGTRWSPVPAPAEWDRQGFRPLPVSCGAPGSCVVTAWSVDGHEGLWHWDGAAWAPLAEPAGVSEQGRVVACVAARDCLVLGAATRRWRDGTWTELGAPPPVSPSDLWCASATSCLVVGTSGSPGAPDEGAGAARWDGTTWHDEAPPADQRGGVISAVDCAAAENCVAVGRSPAESGDQPLALRRSAAGWTTVDVSALPPGGELRAVGCPASGPCVIGGIALEGGRYAADPGITGVVSGTAAAPRPSPGLVPRAIDCPGSRCFAVGTSTAAGGLGRAAEWDGQAWTPAALPYSRTLVGVTLADISCPTVGTCIAVGLDASRGLEVFSPFGFAVEGDGTTWRRSDDAALADGSIRPVAVSCPTASFCVAAGEGVDPAGPALRVYDGQRWSVVDLSGLTMPPGYGGGLQDVSCPSPVACLAVGESVSLRWDGRSWSPITTAADQPPATAQRVSCWAADRCIALQSHFPGPVGNLARWDGSTWTGVHNAFGTFLYDLSCAREGACVAVGYRLSPVFGPVALRQTATGWRAETATGGGEALVRVSCALDGACVALGAERLVTNPAAAAPTAVISMTPGSWSATAPPPPRLGLGALACTGRTCNAVGGTPPPGSDRSEATATRLTW